MARITHKGDGGLVRDSDYIAIREGAGSVHLAEIGRNFYTLCGRRTGGKITELEVDAAVTCKSCRRQNKELCAQMDQHVSQKA